VIYSEEQTIGILSKLILQTLLCLSQDVVGAELETDEVTTVAWNGHHSIAMYTGWPKIRTIVLYALTLPNINRFSKVFHSQNQEKICSNIVTKDPTHLKFVATLPCEMSSVLKQQMKTKRLL